jgi:sugar fermentation stimulation protein A
MLWPGDRMGGGVYIAVFELPADRTIRVGRLGRFRFAAGVYLYVGSAQRNMDARLARHARRRKVRRWHIDYLSAHARMLGAIVRAGPKRLECGLARELAARFAQPVPRFGASDCRCPSHLFFTGEWTAERPSEALDR